MAQASKQAGTTAKRSKRSKRKAKRRASETPAQAAPSDDTMSQVVVLCQEQRWREAALLCRRARERAKKDGRGPLAKALQGALGKIEYSLRRQMAAALVLKARHLLKKEYLLDVGE